MSPSGDLISAPLFGSGDTLWDTILSMFCKFHWTCAGWWLDGRVAGKVVCHSAPLVRMSGHVGGVRGCSVQVAQSIVDFSVRASFQFQELVPMRGRAENGGYLALKPPDAKRSRSRRAHGAMRFPRKTDTEWSDSNDDKKTISVPGRRPFSLKAPLCGNRGDGRPGDGPWAVPR